MRKVISRSLIFFALAAIGLSFCILIAKTTVLLVKGAVSEDKFFVAMVTDGGGINDQSFQQSAWNGLQSFAESSGAKIGYVECQQSSDYGINFDKLADEKANLIWGIGYKLADPIDLASKINPELNYAIADFSWGENVPENVTGVSFRAEESSFLVGYIAGMTTKTNQVGFIGGMRGMVIDQFEYGYRSGAAYAGKTLGKNINVKVQYAESFTDSAKGKAIAMKMFDECDIIFHAAGGAGVGVIEAAKEKDAYAIGADMDQSFLAPKNVLTSAIKDVGKAVEMISSKLINGEKIGGKNFSFGIKEGCVGIPEDNPNVEESIKKSARDIENKIKSQKIVPPNNQATYTQFIDKLSTLKI